MTTLALETEGLSVSFGRFRAVDGVSIQVAQGELRVLLGANGAGKTTLMDLISGRTRSTAGRVLLEGRDVTNQREYRIARAGLGRKFQIPSVFGGLSVRQNLEVSLVRHPGVFANLRFGLGTTDRQRVSEILHLVGLADLATADAATLSHGQTQWLELGMLMGQSPKVILLDEPTAGMTQAETAKTAEIINGLRGRHTLLVVEHDMAFVREIAERITVLHLGKVLAEGSVAEIEANAAVKAAYLGTQEISEC
ncbi:urea ABC transporter ATP-binding protein UrtD [Fertoebacter nigrum]|uniref:Urea ABC transporter ATP-binding protein UrtD n=1 Tax=Fertoeibacter niger TaxID=2656921 RepID=A0A8X8H1M9_9RHOB|nr:urea ABC transporter ATP-binding protein UrtD [Fertoeibacter niger]NUB45928.1 urea ABC transporter ATP-binding protein UrtD [Fertoeibacter niger]